MKTEWRNIEKNKEEILSKMKTATTVIVFDTETTGLKDDAKIIQFSAIKYYIDKDYNLFATKKLDTYINPEVKIPEKITKITGITDEIVSYSRNESELAPCILKFMADTSIWAGYNVKFDIRMLKNMANRCGYECPEVPDIDVLEMAKDFTPQNNGEGNNLETVYSLFFPDKYVQFHDSCEDTKATATLLQIFLKKYAAYESQMPAKRMVHLEKGNLFINPRAKSQKRIRVLLSEGELGDIYYDIIKKIWCHKSAPKAKKLFESIDMEDLEKQFLDKYAVPFGMSTMEEVAKKWQDFVKNKDN